MCIQLCSLSFFVWGRYGASDGSSRILGGASLFPRASVLAHRWQPPIGRWRAAEVVGRGVECAQAAEGGADDGGDGPGEVQNVPGGRDGGMGGWGSGGFVGQDVGVVKKGWEFGSWNSASFCSCWLVAYCFSVLGQ